MSISTLEVPTIVGYGALQEIAAGRYSRVYEALSLTLNRWVAIKVFDEPLRGEKQLAAFDAECKLILDLSVNPNFATVLGSTFSDRRQPCVVMEIYRHSCLHGLEPFGQLSLRQLLSLGVQVSEALADVHRRGIVHGNVTPYNIFLTADGNAILGHMNFLSLSIDRDAIGGRTQQEILSSPHYSAPELLNSDVPKLSLAADQFSLAATLYRLATGHRPFDEEGGKADRDFWERRFNDDPPRLGPQHPQQLSETLARAMSVQPEGRFSSIEAFSEALGQIQRHMKLDSDAARIHGTQRAEAGGSEGAEDDEAETAPDLVRLDRIGGVSADLLMQDDLNKAVTEGYPLPVAYRWRAVTVAWYEKEAIESIKWAHEVLLGYLAIVVLTAMRQQGVEMGHIRDIRHRLSKYKKRGLVIGDWRAILDGAANARAVRKAVSNHPLREFFDFYRNGAVAEASASLTSLRNDGRHWRMLGPNERQAEVEKSLVNLRTVYTAAKFLTTYRLVQVVDARWDGFENTTTIAYEHLRGDNPQVPKGEMVVDQDRIESDSLYLIDPAGGFHLLRPLLVRRECGQCYSWSTFHPDRTLREGGVEYIEYKDMERGHTFNGSEQDRRAVRAVGFLD